jgi:hypothetical protein
MQSIKVSQTVRPTKIAFLVKSKYDNIIRSLVEYNSALWGGVFNPIIAIGSKCDKEALLLLDSTDPDLIVNFSELGLPQLKDSMGQRIIERKALISDQRGNDFQYGICDILPVIEHHVKAEPKPFRPDEPTPASFPVWDENTEIDLYCLFTFGRFPSNFKVNYGSIFRRALRVDTARIRGDNVGSYDPWRLHTPLFATELYIPYGSFERGAIRYREDHIILVGDMSELSDLVDFWNLRCMGVEVFFLPYTVYTQFKEPVTSFLKYGHYEIGTSRAMHSTLVQKSRSIDKRTFGKVCNWIKERGEFDLILRESFPLWGKGTECAKFRSKEKEDVVMLVGDQLTEFRLGTPPFLEDSDRWVRNKHSYHVALQFRGYYGNEYCFRFPLDPNVEELCRRKLFLGSDPKEVRINREGIVLRTRYQSEWQQFYPVPTLDVFKELFRTGGLVLKAYSEKGRYTSRMIELLGGIRVCRILRKPAVRELLKKLQSGIENGDERRKEASVDKIEEILNSGKKDQGETHQTIIDVLDKQQVIRPGLRLKCDFCYKTGWYSIKEIGETFLCRYCGVSQRIIRIDRLPWLYRSHGLFHTQDIGHGSIAVILVLSFFHSLFWSDVKYLPSIEIMFDKSNPPRETDFALLVQRERNTKHRLIVGEATTQQTFKSDDFSLMEKIASRISNVAIVFATLRSKMTSGEKTKISGLTEKGCQVIILTKRELESGDFPWTELPKELNYSSNIQRMVAASNQLYLT